MKTISEFSIARREFVAKYGDELLTADEKVRQRMCQELTPLARFAKLPTERLLQAITKRYAEGGV